MIKFLRVICSPRGQVSESDKLSQKFPASRMAEVLAPLSDTDPPKGPTYRQHWTSGGPWFWGLGEWKRMLVRSMRPHEAPAALSPRRITFGR